MIYFTDDYELFLRSDNRDENVYHKWNLSNGLESGEVDPIFAIHSSDSIVEVCHKIVDNTGILCSYCDVIYHTYQVPSTCYADFAFYRDSTANCNCLGAYRFADQSSGDVTSWNWSFGDGDSSHTQNPVHYYTEPGFYPVLLETETAEGCHATMVRYMLIRGADNCNLTIDYDVLESYPPQYQIYSNLIDPRLPYSYIPTPDDSAWFGIIQYSWDFGDGNYSMEAIPRHVFKHSGEYLISLNITYSDGFVCKAKLTDYFTGLDQVAGCDYLGTFYRNFRNSGYDFIIKDNGEMFHAQQIIPKINLPDIAKINFSFNETGDTIYIDDLPYRSVVIPCIDLISTCNQTGTVRDCTGLDGCGYLIDLDNGMRLEPVLRNTTFRFYNRQRVRLSYFERTDLYSECMAGITAEISCIEEIKPDTSHLPPPCEQIMLNTSFILNEDICSGTASVEILTPCNAWIYYEMVRNTGFQILWSTGETTPSVSGLCPGDLYFVNITNPITGKTYTAAFSIFQLDHLFPAWTFTKVENTCRFNLPVDDTYDVSWKFNEDITLTGQNVSYTFSSGGDHLVELTVKDNTGTEVYVETIQLSTPTNLSPRHTKSIITYPNPAYDLLYIRLTENSDENVSVQIYNYSGRLVMQKSFSRILGNAVTLNVSDLYNGIYLLVLQSNGSQQTVKFQKR